MSATLPSHNLLICVYVNSFPVMLPALRVRDTCSQMGRKVPWSTALIFLTSWPWILILAAVNVSLIRLGIWLYSLADLNVRGLPATFISTFHVSRLASAWVSWSLASLPFIWPRIWPILRFITDAVHIDECYFLATPLPHRCHHTCGCNLKTLSW